MRNDLLEADAAVRWAESHLRSLDERLLAWLKANVHMVVKNTEPHLTHNMVVIEEKAPFPLSFNVEVGAYINSIRTSLDILTTALAYRHKVLRPDEASFPVCDSLFALQTGKTKAAKFLKRFPAHERALIESVKPYQGGNDVLWALHRLDIQRKHRSLLTVQQRPARLSVEGGALGFVPITTAWVSANNETAIGLLAKNAPHPKIEAFVVVVLHDVSLKLSKPPASTLSDFVSLADLIIKLFDY